jgi:hypothetical protein
LLFGLEKREALRAELGQALPLSVSLLISLDLSTSDHIFSEMRNSLEVWAEALVFENISIHEVLFHLIELIATYSVDITTLQLLFEDLGNRNLTQIGAHTHEVTVQNESVLVIVHLGRELSLILLLSGELLDVGGYKISVCSLGTHALFIL